MNSFAAVAGITLSRSSRNSFIHKFLIPQWSACNMLTWEQAFAELNEHQNGYPKLMTPVRYITRHLHNVPSDCSIIRVSVSPFGFNEFVYVHNSTIKAVQEGTVK